MYITNISLIWKFGAVEDGFFCYLFLNPRGLLTKAAMTHHVNSIAHKRQGSLFFDPSLILIRRPGFINPASIPSDDSQQYQGI